MLTATARSCLELDRKVTGCLPLVQNVNRDVMLNGHNHGLENIDVPTVGDSQTDNVVRFRQQASTQRHPKVPCYYSKNHRLSHPDCVSAFHRRSPQHFASSNTTILGRRSNLANGTGS